MNGIGYKIKKTILYILLILLSVVCMFPFLLMIVNATRSGSEIMKSFTLIPSVYLKENWATVFKYFNLFLGMWNSLKVAVPSTLLCSYFSFLHPFFLPRMWHFLILHFLRYNPILKFHCKIHYLTKVKNLKNFFKKSGIKKSP